MINFKEIMENPNFYIVAPVSMLDVPLEIEILKKEDNTYHTINEVVAIGGHTIEKFTTDETKFMKGFCFSVDTIIELIAMLPNFNLVYKMDMYFVNTLKSSVATELAKPEWNNEDES